MSAGPPQVADSDLILGDTKTPRQSSQIWKSYFEFHRLIPTTPQGHFECHLWSFLGRHSMSRLKLVIPIQAMMCFSMMTTAVAQDGELPNYAPLLPQTKARAWAVDPQKGYVVRELKPNVYLITRLSGAIYHDRKRRHLV
jgi:hypothetical protein